ncbi:protein Muted-like protein [Camelus ferus]|nr:protein Muted-like protein [Camelus ferus]
MPLPSGSSVVSWGDEHCSCSPDSAGKCRVEAQTAGRTRWALAQSGRFSFSRENLPFASSSGLLLILPFCSYLLVWFLVFRIPVLQTNNGPSLTGLTTIAAHLVKQANKEHLLGSTAEEKAVVQQWLEYRVTRVDGRLGPDSIRAVLKEKRGLREMRVLENLKNMIHETNEHMLPTCGETMRESLDQVLQRRKSPLEQVLLIENPLSAFFQCKQLLTQSADSNRGNRSEKSLLLKHQELSVFENQKTFRWTLAVLAIHNDHLLASEKQHIIQWEEFMKGQHSKQAAVDEEHRRAVGRLREQYAEMEKDLAKFSTF